MTDEPVTHAPNVTYEIDEEGYAIIPLRTPYVLVHVRDSYVRLEDDKENDADLLFTWEDAPGADDYRVFADSAPDGGFPLVVGTADSGTTGLVAPVPPGSKFFVVAARIGNCLGPK